MEKTIILPTNAILYTIPISIAFEDCTTPASNINNNTWKQAVLKDGNLYEDWVREHLTDAFNDSETDYKDCVGNDISNIIYNKHPKWDAILDYLFNKASLSEMLDFIEIESIDKWNESNNGCDFEIDGVFDPNKIIANIHFS